MRWIILLYREMKCSDYDEIYELWNSIEGFAIRHVDDSRDGIERFIKRNPKTSIVAISEGKIVGTILCGHDGRNGSFYHVCVDKKYRKKGVGSNMVEYATEALRAEGISKISLIAFVQNEIGNAFWKHLEWKGVKNINYYEHVLNDDNTIKIIGKEYRDERS